MNAFSKCMNSRTVKEAGGKGVGWGGWGRVGQGAKVLGGQTGSLDSV